MKKLFIIGMLISTVFALIYVDNVCATDEVATGSGILYIEDTYDFPYEEIEQNKEDFIEPIIGEVEYLSYTDEELELLAHLIFAEAGSDWCSDKMQQYTGSVVLNRMTSTRFPNTMYDVIYQSGQYSVVRSGAINKVPNERAYNCARYLLENGSQIPHNVVYQSSCKQGKVWAHTKGAYYCYGNA